MDEHGLQADYAAWLDRVTATYEAVAYTCGHRLHDRELGRRVSAAVVAGLVARPGVFRYQGLPYSGRIATIAEDLLDRARHGVVPGGNGWPELRAALAGVSPSAQEVFVLACVHGRDVQEIAVDLGCPAAEAAARREEVLRLMADIGTGAVRAPR